MYLYNLKLFRLSHEQKRFITLKLKATTLSPKQKQWITFKVSMLEMKAIEDYCRQSQRTKTDILRELIRKLPTFTNVRDDNPV